MIDFPERLRGMTLVLYSDMATQVTEMVLPPELHLRQKQAKEQYGDCVCDGVAARSAALRPESRNSLLSYAQVTDKIHELEEALQAEDQEEEHRAHAGLFEDLVLVDLTHTGRRRGLTLGMGLSSGAKD